MDGLFDDPWFTIAQQHVINTITKEEYGLYKAKRIRKIYESFEHMVLDNIEYYDRIIRTIVWLYENKFVVRGKMVDTIKKNAFKVPMTPTVFYYIILMPTDALVDEMYLAFPSLRDHIGSTFLELFKPMVRINAFKMNMTYCKGYYGTKNYAEQLELDKTPSKYLNKVLHFMSDDILAVTKQGLIKDMKNIVSMTKQMVDMYNLFEPMLDKKANEYCNIKPTKVMLFSPNSEYECIFEGGKVIRQSVRNWQKCFKFDKVCSDNLEAVYKWIDTSVPEYDCDLVLLMNAIAIKYERHAIAVRRSVNKKVWSRCKFKKCWSWWRLTEETFFGNDLIRTDHYHVSEQNIGKTLIRNGYYVVGKQEDYDWMLNIVQTDDLSKLLTIYQMWIDQMDNNRQSLLVQFRYNLDNILNRHLPYIYK